MESSRYLELLEADADRIVEVAAKGLDAPVPSCEGWTVRDVVTHLARVYLHKVECMRLLAAPDPWPPDLQDRKPIELLRDSKSTLVGELRSRRPEDPTYTWFPADQTVGFWYRRMAQETVVHRVDVELAHDALTDVDPDLAADGVDEALTVMLAGDWSDYPVEEAAGKVVDLSTGGRTWRVRLDVNDVKVGGDVAGGADGKVSGDPSHMLLWVWGRAALDGLSVEGDPAVIASLRRRFAMATQ